MKSFVDYTTGRSCILCARELAAIWPAQWCSGQRCDFRVRQVRFSIPGIPGPANIQLGCNLGQVVHSHRLTSLLSSKKLGYKREYSDWTDFTA